MERSHTPKGQRARERILAAAEKLIAARGFHGTSMRDVAAAARLPLATTVYHFAKKEQLYATVLGDIAAELDRDLDDAILQGIDLAAASPRGHTGRGDAALDAFVLALVRWMRTQPARVKLLLRELLDNPARIARAAQLPLGPFLERAATLVASRGVTTGVTRLPEVAVLHLVGALSYFVAAWPTVERILGPDRARRVDTAYEREAIVFARHLLGIAQEAHRGPRAPAHAGRASARSPRV